MKKILLILLLVLGSLNLFSQAPGFHTFALIRDSICVADSCVTVFYPDTLVNPEWVRNQIAASEAALDSLTLTYIDVQNIDADTISVILLIPDTIKNTNIWIEASAFTFLENGDVLFFLQDVAGVRQFAGAIDDGAGRSVGAGGAMTVSDESYNVFVDDNVTRSDLFQRADFLGFTNDGINGYYWISENDTTTFYKPVVMDFNIIQAHESANRTIYIDPAGDDDTGDGSIGTPFQSPLRALQDIKNIIENNVTITIHANAGSYTWDNYGIEEEFARIEIYSDAIILFESDMTQVASGFTLSADATDIYKYTVSGTTFTINEHQDRFLLAGGDYYPIAHNVTDTIWGWEGAGAATSIYEPSATFTLSNKYFSIGTPYSQGGDQAVLFEHIKFSLPTNNILFNWSGQVEMEECQIYSEGVQTVFKTSTNWRIERCMFITESTGDYGIQLKMPPGSTQKENVFRQDGATQNEGIQISQFSTASLNGVYVYNFETGIAANISEEIFEFGASECIIDSCTNGFSMEVGAFVSMHRKSTQIFLRNVDYLLSEKSTNNELLGGYTFQAYDIVGTPEVDYVTSSIKNKGYINPQRNISLIIPGIYKENVVTVGSSAKYRTIEAALSSITDNDSANRYCILVEPGVYTINNPITLNKYISLRSYGGIGTAILTAQNPGCLIKMDSICSIQGFSIINSDCGIHIDSIGSYEISDIIFNSVDTAIHATNPLNFVFANNIFFASESQKINRGILIEGGRLSSDRLLTNVQDSIGIMVELIGSNSFGVIDNISTFSTNVDTVIHAHDTATVVINTSTIYNAVNGLVASNYSNIKFNGNTHNSISGTYTDSDATSILAGYANNDDNDNALVIEGQELHVGDAEQGFEVCIGQGDSYSDDLLAYIYDGSSYWSTGDSLKHIDGIYVEFPNTSVNTALYLASDVASDTILHYGIKVENVDSMTVGSGEVIAEYWNGSAWTEFNSMVTDGSAPYAYNNKSYFEQTQSTHIRYTIALRDSNWIASDPVSLGSVRKWVRFRIATAITESPQIDQIKLHSSRFEVNDDGFLEFFGDARASSLLPVNIGSGQPFEGNMQSQTIYVDENIGVGFQNNRFTATGDKLGYSVNLPDNVDTGCPVNIIWSGRYVTGGTAQWTVRYRIVSPDSALYTTEPAASGLSGTVVVNATVTSGINEIFKAEIDISEAFPTRQNGFGDQLWFSLQPTTLPGNFDITNIGAAYWRWGAGGHF